MVKTLPVLCVVFQLIFVSFARAEVSDATHLDQAFFNKPDPRPVHVQAEISSTGHAYAGPVDFFIARDRNVDFKQSKYVHVPPGGTITTSIDATVTNARLWDIDQPNLYEAGRAQAVHCFPDQ